MKKDAIIFGLILFALLEIFYFIFFKEKFYQISEKPVLTSLGIFVRFIICFLLIIVNQNLLKLKNKNQR